jgi:hypothetical protein
LNVSATNSGGNASYNLKANAVSINTNTSTSSYSFNHTAIQGNQNYALEVTQGTITIIKVFGDCKSGTVASMPAGLVDGINYNTADATRATVVLMRH